MDSNRLLSIRAFVVPNFFRKKIKTAFFKTAKLISARYDRSFFLFERTINVKNSATEKPFFFGGIFINFITLCLNAKISYIGVILDDGAINTNG